MVAKILVVMIVSIASMSINAYRGLNELKPFAKDMMASYAATKRQVFFKLQMPNSVPYIFTALKVSTPNAVISAIVSEYFAEYISWEMTPTSLGGEKQASISGGRQSPI